MTAKFAINTTVRRLPRSDNSVFPQLGIIRVINGPGQAGACSGSMANGVTYVVFWETSGFHKEDEASLEDASTTVIWFAFEDGKYQCVASPQAHSEKWHKAIVGDGKNPLPSNPSGPITPQELETWISHFRASESGRRVAEIPIPPR